MIFATAVGNLLVCLSVCLVRKLRRAPNFLLVSLAVSDLCVALLVEPLALHYELVGEWRLGRAACDMWVAADVTCCTASILNLCMISVDRYLAITKPLTYGVRRRSRRTYLSIAGTWAMSALVSLFKFLFFFCFSSLSFLFLLCNLGKFCFTKTILYQNYINFFT